MSAAEDAATLAKALKVNASNMGLTWNLRMATVVTLGGAAGISVKLDGDNAASSPGAALPVPAIPLIEGFVAGTRVMTLWIPPHNLYIIGKLEFATPPRVDSITSTAGVTAETVVLTTPAFTFKAGWAYRVRWRGQTSATGANTTTYRVRRTGLTGTVLSIFQWVFTAINSDTLGDTSYVAARAADVSDVLVLTLQASAATTGMAASVQNVRYFEVEVAGPADRFPNAVNL